MKPDLIVETGHPIPALVRHGPFGHWIRVAAGLRHDEVNHCVVIDGEPLPPRDAVSGVLITGSGAMVSDREPWSERCADWLRAAANDGVPLFGICYGHQLLAHAFGGQVGYNPRGREMGTVDVQLHAVAAADPLFAGLPGTLRAQATHRQSVLAPPPGAVVLARSALDDCQAFRWGGHAWGVQFHPEFSVATMREYIRARRDALAEEGRDALAMLAGVAPAPQARQVLRRFVRWLRSRSEERS